MTIWRVALIALGLVAVVQLADTMWKTSQLGAQAAEVQSDELRCLALTLYWEARGEGREAMVAVAWAVLNRRSSPDFPDTICRTVRDGGETPPCQFSYWCDGEPEEPQNDDAWKTAKEIAAQMLEDPPRDPTGGALYFHSVDIAWPWSKDRRRTVEIGRHIFYQ